MRAYSAKTNLLYIHPGALPQALASRAFGALLERFRREIGFPYARVSAEMKRTLSTVILVVWYTFRALAQSPEFNEPWKNPKVALAIDPYEENDINWDKLSTDTRVVAIIHRATIGDRADKKYAERKIEAKKRSYRWGA